MSTKVELARMTIDMPKGFHKKLKAVAAVMGTSMRELVLEALADYVAPKKPTARLRKAIEDIEAGRGLIEIDDLDAYLKKMRS